VIVSVEPMRVPPEILDSPDAVGRRAAGVIADAIATSVSAGERFVLGCPSGRSPVPTYAHLARLVVERDLDLRSVIIALMDEYVVRSGDAFAAVDTRLPHSCLGFARDKIIGALNAAARPGHGVQDQHLWHPDPAAAPGDYDHRLAAAGGIDLFLLASGASDGHVAFNPAGTDADTVTRVVELTEPTRRDNLETFPTFRGIDEVPRYGVTVGIATIRRLSRAVIMIVTGSHKQTAALRLAAAEHYDPQWPATVLSDCASATLLADRDAAALLPATT
jgi:glucosamine-6-phosphate deaminase